MTTLEQESNVLLQEYGRAMFLAQVLEKLLVDALLLTGQVSKRVTAEERLSYLADLSRDNLGKLIANLGAHRRLPRELFPTLENARELRNYLAHSCLREKLTRKRKSAAVRRHIGYLQDAQLTLRNAVGQLHTAVEAYRKLVAPTLAGRGVLKRARRSALLREKRRLKGNIREEPVELPEDSEQFEYECEICSNRYSVDVCYSATRADAIRDPEATQYRWLRCPGCGDHFEVSLRDTDIVDVYISSLQGWSDGDLW